MKNSNPAKAKPARISVSFDHKTYILVQHLAQQQDVSAAWVIRRAVESYLQSQWPLLEKRDG